MKEEKEKEERKEPLKLSKLTYKEIFGQDKMIEEKNITEQQKKIMKEVIIEYFVLLREKFEILETGTEA
jgi:hypothetical protein